MGANLFEPQPDPLLGRTLDGRYEVVARLGVGGVGMVYRAKQAQLGRFVAIKVLHRDAAASPEWRARFQREARALSALAHPNVVPVTDSGVDRGVPYLVMEHLQGKTLADLIAEGPLPLWRALDIARQILRGLAFAHSKAIVHRDLKPANVFLQALPDQADHVRLLDFGMAKFLEGAHSRTMAESLTRVGVVFGTPAYMSPEQIKASPVDARSDVYSAGVLLFELLAARRPFVADDHEGYITGHLTEAIPSLAKVRPGLTAAPLFQPVVEKAMAKKPAGRFKDAGAMLAALEQVIAKLPPEAMRATGKEMKRKTTPRPVRTLEPPPPPPPARAARARSGGSRWRFLRRAVFLGAAAAAGIAVVATYLRSDGAKPVETVAQPAPTPPKKTQPLPPPKPALPPPPVPSPAPVAQATPTPAPTSALPAEPAAKPEPPPIAPPPEEKPKPAETKAQRKEQPETDARDPWKEPVPKLLKPIRDRLNRGAKVSQKALKPVYAYAHDNPDDPRPWLLLGHAYGELDWYSDSIERYQKALSIDNTVRGDPHMLPDLIKAAVHPVAGRAGARAIRDIYGAEAIPALENAIERRGTDSDATTRLDKLRNSLSP